MKSTLDNLKTEPFTGRSFMAMHKNDTPRITIRHKPTGISVTVGQHYHRSMGRQRAMAMKILRSKLAAGPEPTDFEFNRVIRKYDLTPGLTRVVDLRSGRETKDVEAVLAGGLELIRSAKG